jgi:hypothetical protein
VQFDGGLFISVLKNMGNSAQKFTTGGGKVSKKVNLV